VTRLTSWPVRWLRQEGGYKIVGVWKETASGTKDDRAERKKVLALAQARNIDIILVTELTRWGRSMLDLFHTLQDLQAWSLSLVAQTGLQFDLRSAQGKLIASLMAALAEFERDLLPERVRSGIAAAHKRGVVFGRRPGPAHQGGPLCRQSAKARGRRPIVPGNKPPAGAEQEHGLGYRQAQSRYPLPVNP
jgi:DNA invertase Pin-like site-specific DNA recombinase